MLQITREKEPYLADLEARRVAGAVSPAWVRTLRERGATGFRELRFPNTHDEDWKYTSVAPILGVPFRTAAEPGVVDPAVLAPLTYGTTRRARLVFVDGHYVPSLSSTEGLASRVLATSLATLAGNTSVTAERHLGHYARPDTHVFTALNTALLDDGAVVVVPAGTILEAPIQLLFVSSDREQPTGSHPRVLIVVGRGAEATVVETHAALGSAPSFANAVAEIMVGEGAGLTYYKVVRDGAACFHVGTTQVQQERDSRFTSFAITLGGPLVRNDLNVALDAEGAECTLNGLYLTAGGDHVDNHTFVDHARPHGTSREVYKGVLDGSSRAVFNGKVFVRPGANGTDAQQTNRNLLLSNDAHVDTKPQLEIFADDVRCTHGAAIGQLDDEMIFYLNSRGMSDDTARRLLTYGFAGEVLEAMGVAEVRATLDDVLAARLAARRS
ncbi:MAG: Fe-S cluster assembly protein SufD [Chloroflexota bacterium]|nr:Fe-S cluster assembly protein SufD [Chloroflexota bacterium]